MALKRAFIAFDFDHDEDLRNLLVGQAANPDTPFEIKDRSLKEPLTGDWKDKVRRRMDNVSDTSMPDYLASVMAADRDGGAGGEERVLASRARCGGGSSP